MFKFKEPRQRKLTGFFYGLFDLKALLIKNT